MNSFIFVSLVIKRKGKPFWTMFFDSRKLGITAAILEIDSPVSDPTVDLNWNHYKSPKGTKLSWHSHLLLLRNRSREIFAYKNYLISLLFMIISILYFRFKLRVKIKKIFRQTLVDSQCLTFLQQKKCVKGTLFPWHRYYFNYLHSLTIFIDWKCGDQNCNKA